MLNVFSEDRMAYLQPASHPPLVGQVLLSEGAFQILLLAPDHLALDHYQHHRQQEDCPQRVPKNGYPKVDHRQGKIARVAGVAERTFGG